MVQPVTEVFFVSKVFVFVKVPAVAGAFSFIHFRKKTLF